MLTSKPVADQIAGYFGGGGHPFAAGFRTYDVQYNDVVADVVKIMPELIEQAAVTKAEMEQS